MSREAALQVVTTSGSTLEASQLGKLVGRIVHLSSLRSKTNVRDLAKALSSINKSVLQEAFDSYAIGVLQQVVRQSAQNAITFFRFLYKQLGLDDGLLEAAISSLL